MTLPVNGTNGHTVGSAEVDLPLSPVDMSKSLYQHLRRDARRKLQMEAHQGTRHRTPRQKTAGALVIHLDNSDAGRLTRIAQLLGL